MTDGVLDPPVLTPTRHSDAPTLLQALITRERAPLIGAISLGALGGLSGAGLVALIGSAQQDVQDRTRLLSLFVAALLLRLASSYGSKLMLVRIGQRVVRGLRASLLQRVLASSLRSLTGAGAHRVAAMLTTDIAAVSLLFTNIPTLCVNGAIVLGCLIYVCVLSPALLALTLAAIALGYAGYRLLSRRALHGLARARHTEGALFSAIEALTRGFQELKLSAQKRHAIDALLAETSDTYARENVAAHSAYARSDVWNQALFFVPIVCVLFADRSRLSLEPAIVSAYVLTFMFMIAPLTSVLGLLPLVGTARVSANAIEALTAQLPPEPTMAGAPLLCHGAWRQLTVRELRFTHAQAAGEGFAIGPLSFELRPGEIVFLVGGNGSGKSTFAKLLAGLYTASGGEIAIDGEPVSARELPRLRESFSAILSDFVFADLPVAIGREAREAAQRQLALLRLDHVVHLTTDGRFSRIDLSAGQKKRLAMVSALLEDRPVLLLDEWAAEQDPASRAFFYEQLLPSLRARGIAVVAVTHDEQFFHCADRLVHLEYGRIRADHLNCDQRPRTSAAELAGLTNV